MTRVHAAELSTVVYVALPYVTLSPLLRSSRAQLLEVSLWFLQALPSHAVDYQSLWNRKLRKNVFPGLVGKLGHSLAARCRFVPQLD